MNSKKRKKNNKLQEIVSKISTSISRLSFFFLNNISRLSKALSMCFLKEAIQILEIFIGKFYVFLTKSFLIKVLRNKDTHRETISYELLNS